MDFSQSQRVESKIKVQAELVSVRALFWVADSHLLTVSSRGLSSVSVEKLRYLFLFL